MIRAPHLVFLGALCLALSMACGDDGMSIDAAPTTPDATPPPDSDPSTCVGKPDGTPCGDAMDSECDHPDHCVSGFCFANFESAGLTCGDPTDTQCNRRDTCDGLGGCTTNITAAGVPCGDSTNSQCTAPDECDGEGLCSANHYPDGLACGSNFDDMCTNPDSCQDGACSANNEPDNLACDDCSLGTGQCAGCLTGDCMNVCGGPYGLLTPLDGTRLYDGNMFDVRAVQTVEIQSFDILLRPGLHTIDVYYVAGSYFGLEGSSFEWTHVGSTTLVYNDEPAPTTLPIPVNLVINAGETYGFYITTHGTDIVSTTGTSEGSLFMSDGNIELFEGVGNTYPFSYHYGSRIWNGRINYVTNPPCSVVP